MAKDAGGHGSEGYRRPSAHDLLKSHFNFVAARHSPKDKKTVHAVVSAKGDVLDWTTGGQRVAERSGKFYPENGHKVVKVTVATFPKMSAGGRLNTAPAKRAPRDT